MIASLILTAVISQAPGWPTQAAKTEVIHIVTWEGNAMPKPIERSDQLPLSDDDLIRLSKAGFEPAQMVKMIEERRCACDASADGLIRLKKAGVSKEALAAVSMQALPPNRSLKLDLTFDFTGEGQEARDGYLYIFVNDGDLTRMFTASVGELLALSGAHQRMLDPSDVLLPKTIRRIRVVGDVVLKAYGEHTLMAVFSPNPSILHPSQLRPEDRTKAQSYTFNYPRASLQSICKLSAGFKRDAMIVHTWHFQGSQFACEWN